MESPERSQIRTALSAIHRRTLRPLAVFLMSGAVRLFYRDIGFAKPPRVFWGFLFQQKILGRNRAVPWPVHPTSTVVHWNRITRGANTLPGIQPGNYIQAASGIALGSDVRIAPNVGIISSNHDMTDFSRHVETGPIRIGSHVWIGMNSVVLPGVTIGSNVVIGAGSIVSTDIPSDCVAVGNPCRKLRDLPPAEEEPTSIE